MKFSALLIASVAQVATAHYFIDTNVVGGVKQPAFKYVRKSTRATLYNPIKFSNNPLADIRDGSHIDGPDIRCNQGAFSSAGKTQVLTVKAGDEVRGTLAVGAKFQHPGPEFVYMSLAPGGVQQYDGSGDWFKIHEQGVCDGGDFTSTAWCDYNKDYISATIPKDTPDGEYLVRFEHIGVHRCHVNQPEHYVSCLQVKVVGGGSGAPGPMVKVSSTLYMPKIHLLTQLSSLVLTSPPTRTPTSASTTVARLSPCPAPSPGLVAAAAPVSQLRRRPPLLRLPPLRLLLLRPHPLPLLRLLQLRLPLLRLLQLRLPLLRLLLLRPLLLHVPSVRLPPWPRSPSLLLLLLPLPAP
jgi:hypothetical protein